jgi:hypothetical protein
MSSNNNATTKKIAKKLSNEFKNLPDPPGQWVKNTFEFVERVKDVVLDKEELLVSFDVTVGTALIVLILAAMKHLNVWLKSIGMEVTMTFGTSMGNALSPFDANSFIGALRA